MMRTMIQNIISKICFSLSIQSTSNHLLRNSFLCRGTALARRLKEREHEIEEDNRDRRHEKQEIEELRQKLLLQDNINDIELEIKRRLEKEEDLIRKRLADLARASDESADESDNDEESKNSRKDNTTVPTDLVNTSKMNSSDN